MNALIASSSRLRRSGLSHSMMGVATAGAAGAVMTSANAEIVYSGPQNLSTSTLVGEVFAEDVEPVNIDSAGVDEFQLVSFNSKGSDFHDIFEASSDFGAILDQSQVYLQRLDYGDLISDQSTYHGGQGTAGHVGVFVDNLTEFLAPEDRQWEGGSNGYIGFRFNPSGGQDLYGWGHITISPDRTLLTLVDWAYDDTGVPIHAGEIPEPATCMLFAGSVALAGLWRGWTRRATL